jgi:hypothetical protein
VHQPQPPVVEEVQEQGTRGVDTPVSRAQGRAEAGAVGETVPGGSHMLHLHMLHATHVAPPHLTHVAPIGVTVELPDTPAPGGVGVGVSGVPGVLCSMENMLVMLP